AVVSAAALIATPHAYAYDFTVTAIAVAFLAEDQIRFGPLRGEQAIAIAMFVAALAILISFGSLPLGSIIIITLLWLILRRDLSWRELRLQISENSRKIFEMPPFADN